MRKVLYAILNYRSSFDNTKEIFEQVPANSPDDILISRRGTIKFNEKKLYKNVLKPDRNVAKSKNDILNYAKENGYEYCFIIEDDLVINNDTAFDKYLELMDQLSYPVLFYGYDNKNRVLNNIKPNPCLAIRVAENHEIFLNRNPCNSMILFKVSDDMQMFDERLTSTEFEFYLWDLTKSGKLRSFGFFPDIALSWGYFSNTEEKKIREVTMETSQQDLQLRDEKFELDLDADKYLKFLQEIFEQETV